MAKQLENKHCRGIISAHFELGADRTIPHTSAQSRTQNFLLHFSTNQAILSTLRHTFFWPIFWAKKSPIWHSGGARSLNWRKLWNYEVPGSVHYDEWARAYLKWPEIAELALRFFWQTFECALNASTVSLYYRAVCMCF